MRRALKVARQRPTSDIILKGVDFGLKRLRMCSIKELSMRVSSELDNIGFNESRIQERILNMDKCSKAKDNSTKRITCRDDVEKIIVGSQREGLGCDGFDDLDVLQIDHGIMCMPDTQTVLKDGKTVFEMIHKNVPAGYCYLKLLSHEANSESYERIKYALVKRDDDEGDFLSSDVFMTRNDDLFRSGKCAISQNTYYLPRQGPSIPKYCYADPVLRYILPDSKLSIIDYVRAFPCDAENTLIEWAGRKRKHGWPTQDIIDYVQIQPASVVPVGHKSSFNEGIQWRICFNLAEIHLVQSFNIVQKKVYVMLKFIAKHILRPISPCITSFVMKNVALWLAEQTMPEKYTDEHLLDRVLDCLRYLQRCIRKRKLRCYMIPERNLFSGKLTKDEQLLLLDITSRMIQIGIPKIGDYFNGCDIEQKADMEKVSRDQSKANVLDKQHTCKTAMMNTEELTEYFVKMHFVSSTEWPSHVVSYVTVV